MRQTLTMADVVDNSIRMMPDLHGCSSRMPLTMVMMMTPDSRPPWCLWYSSWHSHLNRAPLRCPVDAQRPKCEKLSRHQLVNGICVLLDSQWSRQRFGVPLWLRCGRSTFDLDIQCMTILCRNEIK